MTLCQDIDYCFNGNKPLSKDIKTLKHLLLYPHIANLYVKKGNDYRCMVGEARTWDSLFSYVWTSRQSLFLKIGVSLVLCFNGNERSHTGGGGPLLIYSLNAGTTNKDIHRLASLHIEE